MTTKERFIEAITDNIPSDEEIVWNTTKIEIGTRNCIPDKFVRKEITLSWVEFKENKQ